MPSFTLRRSPRKLNPKIPRRSPRLLKQNKTVPYPQSPISLTKKSSTRRSNQRKALIHRPRPFPYIPPLRPSEERDDFLCGDPDCAAPYCKEISGLPLVIFYGVSLNNY